MVFFVAHAAGMSGSVSQQSFSDENVSKQETESHIVQSSMAVKTEDEVQVQSFVLITTD